MLFTLKAAFVMVFAKKQKHMAKATGVGVCHTTGFTRGYSCLTTSWSVCQTTVGGNWLAGLKPF